MKKPIITLLAATVTLAAAAVPAKRGVLSVTQPDGTEMPVLLMGDEFRHIYLTVDSLPLTTGADGFMQYALYDDNAGRLRASGVRASADARLRSAAEHEVIATLTPCATRAAMLSPKKKSQRRRAIAQGGLGLFDSSFPVKGDVKALVILVNYKDVKFQTPDPSAYFSDMLMKQGFSEYGATGSAYDYFFDNSDGQFRPQFDCYGPVDLPNNRSYYGGNNSNDEDKAPEEMIIHAVELLDDEVDFSQYDTDDDGFVDNVYVFYAGRGEADGGGTNSVWPHSYNIYWGAGRICQADGVMFDYYACSNEWDGAKPDGIGTFVHEFSHVMGLPDLYDVDYKNAKYVTPGAWSVLDMGNYNNNSRTPAAYGAFERNALGWNEPRVLDGPADIELEHILGSNESCLIPTEKDTEFFLLENRQKKGWDAYVPGAGMLIWHIDYNSRVWQNNEVNINRSHQYVDIVEAGGTANNGINSAMRSYTFPGSKNVTSFTSSTTPALESWAGKAIDLPITDIKESDGKISFKVAGGSAGIDGIEADMSESAAEYFNLQGIRVASPEAGNIYIVRRGAQVSKELVK
ncbi:MAG: M6 family metalloprotease domain-containing protein [Muribaculaceae bacterium]|nr:M6 family metalloprotease domain-containing protein [Muribaculaceae bacterium]